MITSCGLQQHVTEATHIKGHILELIMTQADDDNLARLSDVGLDHGSDHFMVRCVLQQVKPPPQKATCTVRDFRNMVPSALTKDLKSKLGETDLKGNVNDLVEHFSNISQTVLDSHAPVFTRSRKIRPRPCWYNENIRHEKRKQRRLERKWRKNKLQVHRDAYMVQHEKVVKLIGQSKEKYFKNTLRDCNSKDTFKVLGRLLNNNCRILPTFDTPNILCNKFAQFFTDKVKKIREEIDNNIVNSVSNDNNWDNVPIHSELSTFKELNDKEISDIITSCANKTCSLDCLPTWLVKENISVVLLYIKNIVNCSLSDGIFPHSFKQAIVTPIIKKSSLDWNELKHYRPVSNICFIGKVIEKAVISQLNDHMERNGLNEAFQSAYKNRHSTETALIKVKDDITRALDRNHAVFLIMLDLSAAFDTIDHEILFDQFEHVYGVKGTALQWFKSYMTGRSFKVSINGEMSDDFTLDFGVPQGSIIGPRAFTKYAQYVATIIRSHGFMYHIYADDVQGYHIFNPKIAGDSVTAIFRLSNCIAEIRHWMTKNKLKLNDSKTEFFVASPPQLRHHLAGISIQIGTVEISPSEKVQNLGVVFDSAMNMSSHVTALCKSIHSYLWNISRIRRFIDIETCKTTMRALVLSKLDYGNAVLLGCNNADTRRLQRLQIKAARIIYQVPKRHSASALLTKLHWLSIDNRIIFKTMLYIYKCMNDLAPIYLTNSVSTFTPNRAGLRSSRDTLRLDVPRISRKYGAGSRSQTMEQFATQHPGNSNCYDLQI